MNSSEDMSTDAGVPHIPGPYVSPEQTESFPLKQALYGGSHRKSRECCPCMERDESSGLRVIITCFFVLSLIITVALAAQIYFGDYQLVPHGSVATDSHFCSSIGTDILKIGGNAVDAAVASTFCMGVVHPHITGLGGGGFLLVYDHRKKAAVDVIDFRELAPSNYEASLNGQTSPSLAGQDVGVPGLVRGLGLAQSLHGKLKWHEVVMPSVVLARKGFQVPQNVIWAWKRISAGLNDNHKLQEVFGALEAGQNLTLPNLAGALEKIAILGPDVFYDGALGASILQTLSEAGSSIIQQDLSNFKPVRRKALQSKFSGFDVFVPGAPSGGPLLLTILDLLKNVSINDNEQFISILAEKLEEVYQTHQGYWGDPDFIQKGVSGNGTPWNFPEDIASHVAAVDLNDLYVSVVSGLNTWFGSQIMSDHGFIFNNALRNFDVGNNEGAPEKRPLSLGTPIIVTQSGEVCGRRLVLGASSSPVAVQLLAELLLLKNDGTTSIEAPRFHFMPVENVIGFEEVVGRREPILSNTTVGLLQKLGFKVQKLPKPYQSCNIVEKIEDTLTSHSDSRGGGLSHRF